MNRITLDVKVTLMLLGIVSIIILLNDKFIHLFDLENSALWNLFLGAVYVFLVLSIVLLAKKILAHSIERENQFRRLVELSPEPVLIFRDGKFIYANTAGAKVVGLKQPKELLCRNVSDFMDADNYAGLVNAGFNGELQNQQVEIQKADGTNATLEITSTRITFDGAPAYNVSLRDITCQVKKTESLEEIAFQDSLTGLLNRRGMVEKINKQILNARRFGVMFIDLDGFKQINDTYGHERGDTVLKNVSDYLKSCVSKTDVVARLGGDEFIIILPDTDEDACIRLAEKIIEPQEANADVFGNALVTPSIGIALSPENGEDVETLIKQADLAMYEAKHKGKNNYHFADGISTEVKMGA